MAEKQESPQGYEADYLLGRCMPLLQILDENEQAIELLKDIRDYAMGKDIDG
jgi:hypothetical protein